MILLAFLASAAVASEAPQPVRGEIVVNEDVTIRVKPGLSDIEQNPLNLILDGTVDFLLNFATW
ncbi:hypothetical protein SCRES1_gp29 [Synechococcus phage S-CRES1]|nr:hypothetical protein SCRES1_gp29 [Synechococcus phage S-CRES1]